MFEKQTGQCTWQMSSSWMSLTDKRHSYSEGLSLEGLACAVQEAGKLRDDICFWDNESESDAVCINILSDAICHPTAAEYLLAHAQLLPFLAYNLPAFVLS